MKAGLGNRGKKQVRARHAPEHLAARPSSDAGHEERSRSPIDSSSPAAGNLVQRAKGEPSARQHLVDLSNAKRQDLPCALRAAFQLGDALAKLRQPICAAQLHDYLFD